MQLNDNSIIKAIIKYISTSKFHKYFDFSFKSQKHNLKLILTEILKVIKFAIPWRCIDSIPYSTVYSVYKRLLKFNILKNTYIELLKVYFKKTPSRKLKYQYTDTTIVANKYGSDLVKYNGFKKRKCTKISFITDSLGIPINVRIDSGTKCDSRIFLNQFINNQLISKRLNNKYKKFMLADSIYDVKNVKNLLFNNRYLSIIPCNKKNIKYKKIFKMTKDETKIYAKRITIEHTNNKIKTYRRLNCRYDRNLKTFYGSLWISLLGLILRKL